MGGPGSVAGAGVGGPGSVHSQSGAPQNAVAGGSQGNGPGNSSNTNSGSGGQVNVSSHLYIHNTVIFDFL